MALTPQELVQWVVDKVAVSSEPNWADQNDVSQYRGIGIKYDKQLQDLDILYSSKINRLIDNYERDLTVFSSYIKNFNLAPIELKGGLGGLSDKVMRLGEKWLATKREIEGRTKGYFTRNPVGTVYYIDLDNGSDASPHDGLKVGNYTADSGTGTTTLIETAELGRSTNGDWNGAYLYNVTRSIGVQITTSVYSTGTWTLTHPTITGQVSGDTYFIIDAWKTIEQYTTVTERSPGDIAYVRANTSESKTDADIQFDENGDKDNYIYIIGCDSVTNDPWSDSSDVKPILTFGDNNYQVIALDDSLWYLERLVIKESSDDANLWVMRGRNWYLKDCEFTDNSQGDSDGVQFRTSLGWIFDGCIFKDNLGQGVEMRDSYAKFISCIFDGGVATTNYGLYVHYHSEVECVECLFGQTTSHDNYDIYTGSDGGGRAFLRNCKYNSVLVDRHSFIFDEDVNQVKGAHKQFYYQYLGTITKDTGVVRSGGADSSAKMEPSSDCGLYCPLSMEDNSIIHFPFKIFCKGGTERTITIYIRSLGAWGTYPTASELYVEASYLDHLTDATRTKIVSNDVLDDETTWRAFDVTFTPQQAGFVYLNVYLKLYESGKGIYCDIKPIIS